MKKKYDFVSIGGRNVKHVMYSRVRPQVLGKYCCMLTSWHTTFLRDSQVLSTSW